MLQHKNFDDIGKADIEELVKEGKPESRTLEYKRELPRELDEDKRKFLATISSFANASGGDIIYGVEEDKTKTSLAVSPISKLSPDKEKQRLENMLRDNIDPRIHGINIKAIEGWGKDKKGFVVLIRVSPSFNSPHMITFKGSSRFYSRNSAGKFQLDVDEIRSAFLRTESQANRIRNFRLERLGRIMAGETPVPLSSHRFAVMHIIPMHSFLANDSVINFSDPGVQEFEPGSDLRRYNLDGLIFSEKIKAEYQDYIQIFRHGVIESVRGRYIVYPPKRAPSLHVFTHLYLVPMLLGDIQQCLKLYKRNSISEPILISLSLLGFKGVYFSYGEHSTEYEGPVDRDSAHMQEVMLENPDSDPVPDPFFSLQRVESPSQEVKQALRPMLDSLWNAFGMERCFTFYDEKGNYRSPRP